MLWRHSLLPEAVLHTPTGGTTGPQAPVGRQVELAGPTKPVLHLATHTVPTGDVVPQLKTPLVTVGLFLQAACSGKDSRADGAAGGKPECQPDTPDVSYS